LLDDAEDFSTSFEKNHEGEYSLLSIVIIYRPSTTHGTVTLLNPLLILQWQDFDSEIPRVMMG